MYCHSEGVRMCKISFIHGLKHSQETSVGTPSAWDTEVVVLSVPCEITNLTWRVSVPYYVVSFLKLFPSFHVIGTH